MRLRERTALGQAEDGKPANLG